MQKKWVKTIKKIMISGIFILGLVALVGSGGGGDDGDDGDNGSTPDVSKKATGSVRTDQSKTISTASGAEIFVPEGAVAPTATGEVGTVVFSIEPDTTTPEPELPTGEDRISDIYRFGPAGFVFQRAVNVTIPLNSDDAPENARLYRINETTGAIESIGGVYDEDTHTITAQTTHFCPIFGASTPASSTADGCILLDNSGAPAYTWRNVCPYDIVELYYNQDAVFEGMAAVSPESCTSGWCNQIKYILPQGKYKLCVETWSRDFQGDLPKLKGHTLLPNTIDVNRAYVNSLSQSGTCVTTVGLGSMVMEEAGPCPCSTTPTPSVGTGDLMVTLTWHSEAAIDLDLFVTDPAGEKIYYGHTTSAAGGKLDIDNKCGNYQNGRPENIFWTTAPAGQYKIEVDWFSECSSGAASVGYEVRVINNGVVKTYSNTMGDTTVTVDTITVN